MTKANSTQQELVQVDLEFPGFQKNLKNLERTELEAFFKSLTKIQQMTWQQIYETSSKGKQKRGLNWEKISGQVTRKGNPIASIRVTQKCRARVTRDGVFMRFISLHRDHDTAYKQKGGEL